MHGGRAANNNRGAFNLPTNNKGVFNLFKKMPTNNGMGAVRGQRVCSICQQKGHNKTTCPAKNKS